MTSALTCGAGSWPTVSPARYTNCGAERLVAFSCKLPARVPVHGGNGYEGVLNHQVTSRATTTLEQVVVPPFLQGSRFITPAGYPVMHGSSFLLVVEMGPEGPRGEAFLTCGQSGDPACPHFVDQSAMFARKEWRPVRWREDE